MEDSTLRARTLGLGILVSLSDRHRRFIVPIKLMDVASEIKNYLP